MHLLVYLILYTTPNLYYMLLWPRNLFAHLVTMLVQETYFPDCSCHVTERWWTVDNRLSTSTPGYPAHPCAITCPLALRALGHIIAHLVRDIPSPSVDNLLVLSSIHHYSRILCQFDLHAFVLLRFSKYSSIDPQPPIHFNFCELYLLL